MENPPQNPDFRNDPENFHPCVRSVFCYAVLSVHSNFAIMSLRKRELVSLL